MGEAVNTGDIELWTERRGHGPEVLLIAGLGDPAEAWQAQLEKRRKGTGWNKRCRYGI